MAWGPRRSRTLLSLLTAAGPASPRALLPPDALDVHVSPGNYEVLLLDVNPIADTTQPLLFDWDQLPYGSGASSSSDGEGAAAAPRAAVGAAAGLSGADVGEDEEYEEEGEDEEGAAGARWESVPLLLAESALAVQPGARAACGMPFDMLGLQDGVEELIHAMRRQQAGEGAGGSSEDSGDG
jgi:hypothetical protein